MEYNDSPSMEQKRYVAWYALNTVPGSSIERNIAEKNK